MHSTEIKIEQNLTENTYTVSIDGYKIHEEKYTDWEEQNHARRMAKSVAWDNALAKSEKGKKFHLTFNQKD